MTLHHLKLRLMCRLYRVCWHCGYVQEFFPSHGWYCPNCDMPEVDTVLARRYRVARDVRRAKGIKEYAPALSIIGRIDDLVADLKKAGGDD